MRPAAPAVATHPEAPVVPVEQFEMTRDHQGGLLTIRGDVYRADPGATGVIFCHGFKGFGRWGFYPYLAPHVAAAGLNAITFDFSGSGVGPDRESYSERDAFARNTYTQELADIAAVVAESRQRGWIGERYGVFGHSRGGGGAILHTAAAGEDVAALVTWAAVAHVLRWLPHEAEKWRQRGYTEIVNTRTGDVLPLNVALLEECERLRKTTLNIEGAAARISVPWLLLHGTADESVSVEDAHRLHAAAAGGPNAASLEFALVEGANHVFGAAHPLGEVPPGLRDVVQRTAAFFATYLR